MPKTNETTQAEAPAYQVLLRQEIQDRLRINPKYSAAAMARDLGLSPPFFSQLMNGKRALSDEMAEQVARKLQWNADKRKAFILLARMARAKSADLKNSLSEEYERLGVTVRERPGFRRLKHDSFSLISDWYHFALLELTETKHFVNDEKWIAGTLGIGLQQVRNSLTNLERVGLLSADRKKTESDYRIGDVPSTAIQNFHRQVLKLADRALARQTTTERDFSGCTIAMDPKHLPRARELIRNLQKELMELVAEGEKTSVYQLSMQLFRLDAQGKKDS